MNKCFILILLALLITNCQTEQRRVKRHPFEIDHSITSQSLIESGYRWMPGVDVILYGKKTKDTLDYYQILFPSLDEEPTDYQELNEEEISDTGLTVNKNPEETISPLDMPDTMYNRIWWNNDLNYQEELMKGYPINRYFYLYLPPDSLYQFIKEIDSSKYTMLRESKTSKYYIDQFSIISIHTNDTFHCRIDSSDNGKLEFTSFINIKG